MPNIFLKTSSDLECIRSWDRLLREQEWVTADDVRSDLHFEKKSYEKQEKLNQSIKDAKAAIKKELALLGLKLREERLGRVFKVAYPKENHDPLHNMRILAIVESAIERRKALSIEYAPAFGDSVPHIFHPQYKRVYNGRPYVYGIFEGESTGRPFETLPIDRITSAKVSKDTLYCPAEVDYIDAFTHVIGASPSFDNPKVWPVHILTHSAFMHNLMLSKPLHLSQRELRPFAQDRPGELLINVQDSVELRSWLMHYGPDLEVAFPEEIRQEIQEEIERFSKRYKNNITDIDQE